MGTNTNNLNLYKPAAAESGWDALVNDDIDRLDALAEGWARPNWTFTYISATQFKVTGDKTAFYTGLRKLRINLSASTVYSTVVSASLAGGDTTVTIADAVLDNTLVDVDHSSAPIGGSLYIPKSNAVLAADYTITAENAWENVGLSITLPEAGSYLLEAAIRGFIAAGTAIGEAWVAARLYDSTIGAAVADTERLAAYVYYPSTSITTMKAQGNATIRVPYSTTAQNHVINVQAIAKKSLTTISTKQVLSNTDGKTALSYELIG